MTSTLQREAILVKSERYFDLYDQVFAHQFEERNSKTRRGGTCRVAKTLLQEWLKDPEGLAQALGADPKELSKLTPEELIKYFLDRLKEQTEPTTGKQVDRHSRNIAGRTFGHPPGA